MTTGTEGPRHDPYSYIEYIVTRDGKTTMLHAGLGEYVTRDDGKVIHDTYGTGHARSIFAELTGLTTTQFERAYDRIRSRCSCGNRHLDATRGYPGETLYVCRRCNRVVSSDCAPLSSFM